MKQNGYEKYVKERTPVRKLGPDMAKAFVTGGVICVIGQGILNYCEMLGLEVLLLVVIRVQKLVLVTRRRLVSKVVRCLCSAVFRRVASRISTTRSIVLLTCLLFSLLQKQRDIQRSA